MRPLRAREHFLAKIKAMGGLCVNLPHGDGFEVVSVGGFEKISVDEEWLDG